jgi:hypothetical protein
MLGGGRRDPAIDLDMIEQEQKAEENLLRQRARNLMIAAVNKNDLDNME